MFFFSSLLPANVTNLYFNAYLAVIISRYLTITIFPLIINRDSASKLLTTVTVTVIMIKNQTVIAIGYI